MDPVDPAVPEATWPRWSPLGVLRIVLRGGGLGAAILLWYAVWWLGRLFTLGSRPRAARWRETVFQSWARVAVRVLAVDVSVEGRLPTEPCVLVSNHLSYLDIVVLAGVVRAVFVSKSEVERWPLLGPVTRHMGTIFVDRTAKRDLPRVNRRIAAALADGDTVVLFPEGTSSRGAEVLRFKPSLLEPAVQSSYPVCYACLAYRTPPQAPPASLVVCWWGDMTFFGHVFQLLQVPRIEASVVFGDEIFRETDRKVLADELWRSVSARFQPVS